MPSCIKFETPLWQTACSPWYVDVYAYLETNTHVLPWTIQSGVWQYVCTYVFVHTRKHALSCMYLCTCTRNEVVHAAGGKGDAWWFLRVAISWNPHYPGRRKVHNLHQERWRVRTNDLFLYLVMYRQLQARVHACLHVHAPMHISLYVCMHMYRQR